jgi:hypothetical protein
MFGRNRGPAPAAWLTAGGVALALSCNGGGLPIAEASDLMAIGAAVQAEPGVQAASAGINFFHGNDGTNTKTLVVTVNVDGTILEDPLQMGKLDSAIKMDAKALYHDIGDIDYVGVQFRQVQWFGPFSFTRGMRDQPTRVNAIPTHPPAS